MAEKRAWNIKVTTDVRVVNNSDGSTKINEYICKSNVLGSGSYGNVTLVERLSENNSTRSFAMKQLSKLKLKSLKTYKKVPSSDDPDSYTMVAHTQLNRVMEEIEIMRHLYHKNIVILFEVLENDKNIWFILEHMEKGPVLVFDPSTKGFQSPLVETSVVHEELAKSHLRDIVNGTMYLHSLNIAHRDIKPSNILLNDEGRCHLSDFGCAKRLVRNDEMCIDTIGTYHFVAPECCSDSSFDPLKVDIWAIGVTLYCMLLGKLPFDGETTVELFENIQGGRLDFPVSAGLSDEVRDLLQAILVKDPANRVSLQGILEHPWLSEDAPSF